MTKQKPPILIGMSVCVSLLFVVAGYATPPTPDALQAAKPSNAFLKFLKEIDFTSRLKFEYDDNIFLTEDGEDCDVRQIFTQTLSYQRPQGKHFFQWGYSGNYAYYDQEALGVLGHTANILYSYRPFEKFSIGVRDAFNWLQDSKITTVVGDKVLALGYVQNAPSLEAKYEFSPKTTFTCDVFRQFLNVRNPTDDDYIDNNLTSVRGQVEYHLTPRNNLVGFFGQNFRAVHFNQITEKSSTSNRVFVGLTEKFPNVVYFTEEVGFENINFRNPQNPDDGNIDYRVSVETAFSLYTKLSLSYEYNVKNPSYRSQYTQYASNAAFFSLRHTVSPNVTVFFDYSHELQKFDFNDVLIGEAKVDRKSTFQSLRLTVSRKINPWLVFDVKYEYVKRDTEFALEGYTDNKFSTAITARY